jgi:hypothetical protein
MAGEGTSSGKMMIQDEIKIQGVSREGVTDGPEPPGVMSGPCNTLAKVRKDSPYAERGNISDFLKGRDSKPRRMI